MALVLVCCLVFTCVSRGWKTAIGAWREGARSWGSSLLCAAPAGGQVGRGCAAPTAAGFLLPPRSSVLFFKILAVGSNQNYISVVFWCL